VSIYDRFGVPTVINAAGTVTRLSGGRMHPDVLDAMRDASTACVDMMALQAGACRVIARVTGAEAGIVTSGASAALLLGTAACLAGLDTARMNRLPEVDGARNEVIIVRSQRNMYDRALTVAGARIVEVGLADRYAGSGVRDAAPWEIEAAITARTAAVCYLAQPQSLPKLADVVSVSHAHDLPVLVDAAAQLPPRENLRRFLNEGADLVAFSGGKAIGGPQSSGILAGRADLVGSALMQMLDLDVFADMWAPPEEFARLRQLRGLPQHGIGRSCKVGKEEIVGLLVALERFAVTEDGERREGWRAVLQAIIDAAKGSALAMTIVDRAVPVLEVRAPDARALAAKLAGQAPAILCGVGRREENVLVFSPVALTMEEARIIGNALQRV
jgi:D-glucosaminate-6-phosphate ammonia-lyase